VGDGEEELFEPLVGLVQLGGALGDGALEVGVGLAELFLRLLEEISTNRAEMPAAEG
jgi:hypothetical protein